MRRSRVIALVLTALVAIACSTRYTPEGMPDDQAKGSGGVRPMGHLSWQVPFTPFSLTIDSNGKVSISANASVATPIGIFSVGISGDIKDSAGRAVPPQTPDVTELLVCKKNSDTSRPRTCEAIRIGSGRKVKLKMSGTFEQTVERGRVVIDASPGSTIDVRDDGGPSTNRVRVAARIDYERWDLHAQSQDNGLDFERSRGGFSADMYYDHVTGDLVLHENARVSQIKKYGTFASDPMPTEEDCEKTPAKDWKTKLSKSDLDDDVMVMCVLTAEKDLGYLHITRKADKRPVGYDLESTIWVR
ncbi:hypothetical protein [Longispora albida]|uniref:hypothetical protein n=1 Tax=Longispora albida TaxID=203523 RepID=UPI00037A49A1|nr:hypothetical protein [Longispora albida]